MVIARALRESDIALTGALERPDHPDIGQEVAPGVVLTSDPLAACRNADVLVDFSDPEAALSAIAAARSARCGAVVGTTGFTASQKCTIEKAAADIPVILSPNMSMGVNCFFEIVRAAAALLTGSDAEIVETHHRYKKDAPSGTAEKIAHIIADVWHVDPETSITRGRSGIIGIRKQHEIGIQALRMGDIVGEHSVFFAGTGEVIEITHRCYNREAFAAGAIAATRFLHGKPAGLYDISQVINAAQSGQQAGRECHP